MNNIFALNLALWQQQMLEMAIVAMQPECSQQCVLPACRIGKQRDTIERICVDTTGKQFTSEGEERSK